MPPPPDSSSQGHKNSYITINILLIQNCIGGVIISMLASSVGHGRSWIRARSGQTKDHKIGICGFSAKHTVLSRKSKDGLAQNQDNVSKWGHMSIHILLFQ